MAMKFCIVVLTALYAWFFSLTSASQAAKAGYEIGPGNSSVKISVTWNTEQSILVMQPIFKEDHPLYGLKMKNKVQWQNGDQSHQSMNYDLDSALRHLPEASVKVLVSGAEQMLAVEAISLQRKENKYFLVLATSLIFILICSILFFYVKHRRTISIPNESFSRESAVEAVKRKNWSLLFEILSSDIPWKAELHDLPWEDWKQQWSFASREVSEKNCSLLIKVLQDSEKATAENQSLEEEEEILGTILTK